MLKIAVTDPIATARKLRVLSGISPVFVWAIALVLTNENKSAAVRVTINAMAEPAALVSGSMRFTVVLLHCAFAARVINRR